MDASPDYLTQPSFHSLSTEKTKYSRIKTNLKFIAIGAQIKKMEKAHIRDLTAHLKDLEKKKKQTHPGGVEDWK